jgi:hypothetical protein
MKIHTISRDNDGVGYTEDTLFKVFRTLRLALDSEEVAMACVTALQNSGILFRERFDDDPIIKHKPGYRIRQAIEPLGMHKGTCTFCNAFQVEDMSESYVRATLEKHMDIQHANSMKEAPRPALFQVKCPYCTDRFGAETFELANEHLNAHVSGFHGRDK